MSDSASHRHPLSTGRYRIHRSLRCKPAGSRTPSATQRLPAAHASLALPCSKKSVARLCNGINLCPSDCERPLLALLFAASALNGQELSPKDVEVFLSRLAESRRGAAMQADFREERRLSLMNQPVVETGTVSFLPPDKFRRKSMVEA